MMFNILERTGQPPTTKERFWGWNYSTSNINSAEVLKSQTKNEEEKDKMNSSYEFFFPKPQILDLQVACVYSITSCLSKGDQNLAESGVPEKGSLVE